MAIIDRIKYDGPPDILVWKFPRDNLVLGGQLIVNESQEALFYKSGRALDLFPPGTHTLSTYNIPILQQLVNLPFGGETPFSAEVYYINKVAKLDYRWGTKTPIPVEDPKYKVILQVGCFGQFGLRVIDSRSFITQIVGTLASWNSNAILEYFRGAIINCVKVEIAKFLVVRSISIASITAYIDDVSIIVENRLREEFQSYGLELLNFYITSISIPDSELVKLQKGAFSNLEIDQMGDARFQMMRGLEVMEAAAKNPGAPGTLMGGGIGLGLGLQLAGSFQGMEPRIGNPPAQQTRAGDTIPATASAPSVTCSSCKSTAPLGTKFCNQCGVKFETGSPCQACGATVTPGSRFCSECGTRVEVNRICSSCNTPGVPGSKFCNECGTRFG